MKGIRFMDKAVWTDEFPAAITVTDRHGFIIEMNNRAIAGFEKDGGKNLIGQSVLECHPEPSRTKVSELLRTPAINCYTIEKKGLKKMIYQAPWFNGGKFGGLVEISMEIPDVLPHFKRED
jgi:transcriptional regulator with PAS, ATPase and Fis domain